MTYAKKPSPQKATENSHGPSGFNAVRTLPAVPVLQKAELNEEVLPIQGILTSTPLQKTPEAEPKPDGLKSGLEYLSDYSLDEVKASCHSDKPDQQKKPDETNSRVVANAVTQKKYEVEQMSGFVDNGPENIAKIKLQKLVNSHSPSSFIPKINNKNIEESPSRLIQMKPAASGYSGLDNMFVYKVVVGDIVPTGAVSISVDSDYNILFTIPFDNYGCQIHIHYSPEDVQYKADKIISPGDTARSHVYDNDRKFRHICNEQAIPLIIRCISQEKMQEAKQQRDIKKYERLTFRSLTSLSHAMRGDY